MVLFWGLLTRNVRHRNKCVVMNYHKIKLDLDIFLLLPERWLETKTASAGTTFDPSFQAIEIYFGTYNAY